MIKHTFVLIFMVVTLQSYSQRASLTIDNRSKRNMTTKILKGTERSATLFKIVEIEPRKKQIIYFDEPGRYFTKNQAILIEKDTLNNDTIYNKGSFFEVIADSRRGYSNITLKFSVKESKKRQAFTLTPISRREYEVD